MTEAERAWQQVDRILTAPLPVHVPGQLAAFPLDVPTDERSIVTGAAQLALLDPETVEG